MSNHSYRRLTKSAEAKITSSYLAKLIEGRTLLAAVMFAISLSLLSLFNKAPIDKLITAHIWLNAASAEHTFLPSAIVDAQPTAPSVSLLGESALVTFSACQKSLSLETTAYHYGTGQYLGTPSPNLPREDTYLLRSPQAHVDVTTPRADAFANAHLNEVISIKPTPWRTFEWLTSTPPRSQELTQLVNDGCQAAISRSDTPPHWQAKVIVEELGEQPSRHAPIGLWQRRL